MKKICFLLPLVLFCQPIEAPKDKPFINNRSFVEERDSTPQAFKPAELKTIGPVKIELPPAGSEGYKKLVESEAREWVGMIKNNERKVYMIETKEDYAFLIDVCNKLRTFAFDANPILLDKEGKTATFVITMAPKNIFGD